MRVDKPSTAGADAPFALLELNYGHAAYRTASPPSGCLTGVP